MEEREDARVTSDSNEISGTLIVPLRRIPDERGTIFHMLRNDDDHFERFGEIYFTTIYRDVIKGWHKHSEMTLNYACILRPHEGGALRRPRRLPDQGSAP